jgi:hypothetical protein
MRWILVLLVSMAGLLAKAQKYSLTEGTITFFSEAPLEDIKAVNTKPVSLFNAATGDIAFSVPIPEFQFEKKLMQEHFNEKYLESEKYPKATFSGKVAGIDLVASGAQAVTASGKLTIHGIAREVKVPGQVEIKNGLIYMSGKFLVRLEDHQITIPKLMWQNIAEEVEVTVQFTYKAQ